VKPRSGTITLARHGEPALSRKVSLDAAGYIDFWARYEEGGILEGQAPPAHLIETARTADLIFASSRRRAVESARLVLGERAFEEDVCLIEAPLPPPPLPPFIRLSPRLWGFFSRVSWWWLGHHAGQETRAQATVRARDAARRISEAADQGQNVLVFAHGFFNAMLGLELIRLGWRRTWGRGYKYWSTRRFERR
jgi:broad specificity phosphatase PhoE